jgi:hypothetical protein
MLFAETEMQMKKYIPGVSFRSICDIQQTTKLHGLIVRERIPMSEFPKFDKNAIEVLKNRAILTAHLLHKENPWHLSDVGTMLQSLVVVIEQFEERNEPLHQD